jgi:large subunit ribosomal protein L23
MHMNTIIRRPIVTEKSLTDTKLNKYTFEVEPGATKSQIKAAVTAAFNVDVVGINTVKSKPEPRRTGRRRLPAMTAATKKAVVQIKAGQSIPLFETTGS